MERKSYVYKIKCLVTGEYYFGSSFYAKRDSYWGSGRKIKERIAQYGRENFVKEILGEFENRVEAHKIENEYIEKFRNDEKCLNQMLNRHFGTFSNDVLNKFHTERSGSGNSFYGKRHSDETKLKIHNSLIGNIPWNKGKKNCYSDEARIKISEHAKLRTGEKNPFYGKRHSDETKLKIHNSLIGHISWNKGKKLNEETKQKIRESMIGRTPWNKGKKLNKETGKYE